MEMRTNPYIQMDTFLCNFFRFLNACMVPSGGIAPLDFYWMNLTILFEKILYPCIGQFYGSLSEFANTGNLTRALFKIRTSTDFLLFQLTFASQ